jgi:predicted CoA-binding protein
MNPMPAAPLNSGQIHELLTQAKNVAIVGVSDKPDRPSYGVAQYLLQYSHFKIFFVNPSLDSVLGQKVYHSLAEINEHIDIVDVFRKPVDCIAVLDEAIAIGADAIWLQLGITSEDVATRGNEAGLEIVMDRCLKVDYANFF